MLEVQKHGLDPQEIERLIKLEKGNISLEQTMGILGSIGDFMPFGSSTIHNHKGIISFSDSESLQSGVLIQITVQNKKSSLSNYLAPNVSLTIQLDQNGYLSSKDDTPAIQLKSLDTSYKDSMSAEVWCREGLVEAKDGKPAIIQKRGYTNTEIWYSQGKKHRDGDQAALVYKDSQRGEEQYEWYQKGELHRDGDKPAIVFASTDKNDKQSIQIWYKNGEIHREEDKPAVCDRDTFLWLLHGKAYARCGGLPNAIKNHGGQFWYSAGTSYHNMALLQHDDPNLIFSLGVDGHITWGASKLRACDADPENYQLAYQHITEQQRQIKEKENNIQIAEKLFSKVICVDEPIRSLITLPGHEKTEKGLKGKLAHKIKKSEEKRVQRDYEENLYHHLSGYNLEDYSWQGKKSIEELLEMHSALNKLAKELAQDIDWLQNAEQEFLSRLVTCELEDGTVVEADLLEKYNITPSFFVEENEYAVDRAKAVMQEWQDYKSGLDPILDSLNKISPFVSLADPGKPIFTGNMEKASLELKSYLGFVGSHAGLHLDKETKKVEYHCLNPEGEFDVRTYALCQVAKDFVKDGSLERALEKSTALFWQIKSAIDTLEDLKSFLQNNLETQLSDILVLLQSLITSSEESLLQEIEGFKKGLSKALE